MLEKEKKIIKKRENKKNLRILYQIENFVKKSTLILYLKRINYI